MPRSSPIVAVLVLLGCQAEPDDEGFFAELQALDYRSFDRAPGYEQPRHTSSAPHGGFVDIYVNDVVSEALAGGAIDAWPDGALVVKDGWGAATGDDLRYLAAMEKRDGEWFWAEYRRGTELIYAGIAEPTCTRCHDAGSDGVLAFTLPR